jgi:hypothetical protein
MTADDTVWYSTFNGRVVAGFCSVGRRLTDQLSVPIGIEDAFEKKTDINILY